MSDQHEVQAAAIRVFWAWLFVGLSQMTPMQWVQLVAAVVATVYSAVQTFFVLRDKWWRERK